MRAYLRSASLILFLSVLAYFHLNIRQSSFWGWLLLFFYFLLTGTWCAHILSRFFGFSFGKLRTRIIGGFLSFYSLSLVLGATAIFYHLSASGIAWAFFLNGLLILSLFKASEKWGHVFEDPQLLDKPLIKEQMPGLRLWGLVYLVIVALGFYLLWQARTGAGLTTPWQVIPAPYIYVYTAATALLGFLIFSRLKIKTLILLFCLHWLLTLSFLPLTHDLFYGADGWRHIAAEKVLYNEGFQSITPYISGQTWQERLDWGAFSYANFRALHAVLARFLGIDLIVLNKWFQPLIFALIFPLLLYELARTLGADKREGLLFLWLSFLPFATQAVGAFTLPSNFSFLFFLLAIIMLVRLRSAVFWPAGLVLVVFGVLSLFGYALYLILFWFALFTVLMIRILFKNTPANLTGKLRLGYGIIWLVLGALVLVILPAIELFFNYSNWPQVFSFDGIKQLLGNFSAYYLASGPRPHDIATGNVIFNQTPSFAFVANYFTLWRYWLVGFMFLFFAAIVSGWLILRRAANLPARFLTIFSAGLFGGYLFSRYFLIGDNILTRRLDAVLALLAIILLFVFLKKILASEQQRLRLRWGLAFLITVYSLAIGASYSLGPDTMALDTDNYRAAQFVWKQEKTDSGASCVVSDTLSLLALEAFSGKKIIGGGFPIDRNFAQPEREQIYRGLLNNSNLETWQAAQKLTRAKNCYLLAASREIKNNEYVEQAKKDWQRFGEIIVWKF